MVRVSLVGRDGSTMAPSMVGAEEASGDLESPRGSASNPTQQSSGQGQPSEEKEEAVPNTSTTPWGDRSVFTSSINVFQHLKMHLY